MRTSKSIKRSKPGRSAIARVTSKSDMRSAPAPKSKRRKAKNVVTSTEELPTAASSRSRARKRTIATMSSNNALSASAPSNSAAEETKYGVIPTALVSPPAADTIAHITETVRLRQDFIVAQGNLSRQIKRIVSRVMKQPKVTEKDVAGFLKTAPGAMHAHLASLIGLRDQAKATRKNYDRLAEKLAMRLPVYGSFVEKVKGFGAVGLALILGEAAADLSAYATPAKLWRRFGLHVVSGKSCSTWRRTGGLSKDEWSTVGYSPRRRSTMFVIVDSMLRNKKSAYYGLYQQFKAREVEKAAEEGLTVASANDIPSGESDKYRSLKHIDLRARRKVAKRLLKDLWRAWNGQGSVVNHINDASTRAETMQQSAFVALHEAAA